MPEYHKLTADGFFAADTSYELFDGYVVRRPSPSPLHATAIIVCGRQVVERLPTGWAVRYRSEVTLLESAPEPDLSIVRDRRREYVTRHPNIEDVALVIEVADELLLAARRDKVRIYAAGAVPEHWIINLVDRQIEVYSNPHPGTSPPHYASRIDYRPGGAVPLTLDGKTVPVPVDDLLP